MAVFLVEADDWLDINLEHADNQDNICMEADDGFLDPEYAEELIDNGYRLRDESIEGMKKTVDAAKGVKGTSTNPYGIDPKLEWPKK